MSQLRAFYETLEQPDSAGDQPKAGESVSTGTTEPPPDLGPQQAFSKRNKALRDRKIDICKQGISKDSEFDAVFKKVQDLWDAKTWTGSEVDAAFLAVEQALDAAEDRIAERAQAAKLLQEQRGVFSAKLAEMRARVSSLVSGNFAAWTDFDAAFAALQTLWDASTVTGSEVDKAFGDLDTLIKAAEKRVDQSKLYEARLATATQTLAELDKNPYMPPDALDVAKQLIQDAKDLGGQRNFEGALGKLDTADKRLIRARTLAEEEQEIEEHRDSYLEEFWVRNLKEHGVARDEIDEILTEEQIAEFVRLEKDAQAISNPSKRKTKRREIRELYAKYKSEYKAQLPEEEEAPPTPVVAETPTARLARIHQLKLQFRSMNSLTQLDAEGEIYRTREVFANRGKNFKISGTDATLKDYVAGYDVYLRNGPAPDGKMTQYRKMVVHFHFSDKSLSTIERAHFKNSHSGSDKSHVLIKTSQQGAALTICKRYL